jgi:hypothetical protein
MTEYILRITEDEALVLFEFFHRFDETGKLEFAHPAEYIALMKVAGQIDGTISVMFDPDYESLLRNARNRLADGFEGDVPGMKAG